MYIASIRILVLLRNTSFFLDLIEYSWCFIVTLLVLTYVTNFNLILLYWWTLQIWKKSINKGNELIISAFGQTEDSFKFFLCLSEKIPYILSMKKNYFIFPKKMIFFKWKKRLGYSFWRKIPTTFRSSQIYLTSDKNMIMLYTILIKKVIIRLLWRVFSHFKISFTILNQRLSFQLGTFLYYLRPYYCFFSFSSSERL